MPPLSSNLVMYIILTTSCYSREETIESQKTRRDEKFLRGTAARETREKMKTEQREKEVVLVQVSSLRFD